MKVPLGIVNAHDPTGGPWTGGRPTERWKLEGELNVMRDKGSHIDEHGENKSIGTYVIRYTKYTRPSPRSPRPR
jgi:hypothetical protein